MDEDEYAEYLDDVLGEFNIGSLVYYKGHVLKKLDPIAFRCAQDEEECICDEDCGSGDCWMEDEM